MSLMLLSLLDRGRGPEIRGWSQHRARVVTDLRGSDVAGGLYGVAQRNRERCSACG